MLNIKSLRVQTIESGHLGFIPLLFLAGILDKSLDFMIINLRDKNPKLYYLQALKNSFYKRP